MDVSGGLAGTNKREQVAVTCHCFLVRSAYGGVGCGRSFLNSGTGWVENIGGTGEKPIQCRGSMQCKEGNWQLRTGDM